MTRFLKDILDQPDQLLHSMDYSLHEGNRFMKQAADLIRPAENVFIVAIGASWCAGIAVQVAFNEAGVQAVLCDAADFLYFTRIPPRAVVIFLSRSGKSIEIVNAIPKCKAANAVIVSITNAPSSELARYSTVCLFTNVRFDNSISVSTYSAIILTGVLLAQLIKPLDTGTASVDVFANTIQTINSSIPVWQSVIASAGWLNSSKSTYFMARGAEVACAHESRLLWEEAAKQPATALTTGAFRHGPQEIINDGIHIAIWIGNETARNYDCKLVNDLVEKQVNVIAVGSNLPLELKGHKIEMPPLPHLLSPVIGTIPMQLASEKLAGIKGVDPDNFLYCNFVVEAEGGL